MRKAIKQSTIKWPRSVGDRGTLVAVRRIGNRLSIAIRDNNKEHVAILDPWTPPPSLEEVEAALSHMIGLPILDVKHANLGKRVDRLGF